MTREVWVTGYGLLCALGESPSEWWARLDQPDGLRDLVDSDTYRPFHVHPAAAFDLDRQVPRPGDRRAMGPMMRYGAYAAGLALDTAGIKGEEDRLAETHLVVAAGGGERDWELDGQIIKMMETSETPGADLNRELSDGLRPTLFLAQLPNLFAGNISIIHGVTGSSRTFMGEEAAGVNAVRIGFQRILAGQAGRCLVGAAFNGERPDWPLMYHAGAVMLSEPFRGVWQRPDPGMCFGSAGAFVVLESREEATARGRTPLARLAAVVNDRSNRTPGAASRNARRQWDGLSPRITDGILAVMSGACGAGPITAEERSFLETLADDKPELAVRGTAGALGHTVEASFLANLILAVSCLEKNRVFPPLDPECALESRVETGPVKQVLVTCWGHHRGEGMGLVEAVDG